MCITVAPPPCQPVITVAPHPCQPPQLQHPPGGTTTSGPGHKLIELYWPTKGTTEVHRQRVASTALAELCCRLATPISPPLGTPLTGAAILSWQVQAILHQRYTRPPREDDGIPQCVQGRDLCDVHSTLTAVTQNSIYRNVGAMSSACCCCCAALQRTHCRMLLLEAGSG